MAVGSTRYTRRRIAGIGAGAGGALALAACGAAGGGQSPGAAPAKLPAAALQFWSPAAPGSVSEKAERDIADAFESEHSGWKVTNSYITYATVEDYAQKFATAVAAGTPPDVLETTSPREWGGLGMLNALDSRIAKEKSSVFNLQDFWPGVLVHARFDGKTYAIPYTTDSRGVYYNKDLLAKAGLDATRPPRTWNEMRDWVRRLTERDSGGAITQLGFTPRTGQSFLWTWQPLAGGALIDESGAVPKILYNSPQAVKALTYMVELVDTIGGVAADDTFLKSFSGSTGGAFAAGKLAMIINLNSYVEDLKRNAPGLRFGVGPEPIADDGGKRATYSGGWHLGIPNGAKSPDQAWELVISLTNEKWMLERNKRGGSMPPRKALSNDPFYQQGEQKYFADAMAYAVGRPKGPWGESQTYTIPKALDDAYNKRLTPKEALDRATAELQRDVDKYYATRK
ncbi:MAG TPA: ABC transporter substrate-binding protein [Chloroflexota bacterium]|nr:ABC transporter substrate-binding protein [Chloroflexota bacterium]